MPDSRWNFFRRMLLALLCCGFAVPAPAAVVNGPAVLDLSPNGATLDASLDIDGRLYLDLGAVSLFDISITTDTSITLSDSALSWPYPAAPVVSLNDAVGHSVTGDIYLASAASWDNGSLDLVASGEVFITGTFNANTLNLSVNGGGGGNDYELTNIVGGVVTTVNPPVVVTPGGGTISVGGGAGGSIFVGGSGGFVVPLPAAWVLMLPTLLLLRRSVRRAD